MLKVYKYELKELNSQYDAIHEVGCFEIEGFWQVLTAQYQGAKPVLWVLVNNTANTKTTLRVFSTGTGNGTIPANARYVATVQQEQTFGGVMVWHIFAEANYHE